MGETYKYYFEGRSGGTMPPPDSASAITPKIPTRAAYSYNAAAMDSQRTGKDVYSIYNDILENLKYTYFMTKRPEVLKDYWDMYYYIDQQRIKQQQRTQGMIGYDSVPTTNVTSSVKEHRGQIGRYDSGGGNNRPMFGGGVR